MRVQFNDLSGMCPAGDDTGLMGDTEGIEPKVIEVLSGMDDDDLAETTIDYPELMGRLFKRLRKRIRYRRKLREKFQALPSGKRRRVIGRLMKKRSGRVRLFLRPKTRLAKLMMRVRTKASVARSEERKKRRRKKFLAWKKRRAARRKRIKRPVKIKATRIPKYKESVISPTGRMQKKAEKSKLLPFAPTAMPKQVEEEYDVLPPQQDFMKYLPLAGAAVLGLFVMQRGKAK